MEMDTPMGRLLNNEEEIDGATEECLEMMIETSAQEIAGAGIGASQRRDIRVQIERK
jgi:hypothetical protein